MPTAEANVETEQAGRYLAQLCRHFSHLRPHESRPKGYDARARADVQAHVEWSETHGIVTFSWGQCTIEVNPDALALRAEAPNDENLQRVQRLVADHLERFGSREQLQVNWQSA